MAMSQEDLGWFCDNSEGNYTTNSPYKPNLNHLLSTFTTHQIDYGFYNLSYGHDHKAYAIGLCRGDVMPDSCRSCLNNSITLLTNNCPTQTNAIVWYEDCTFRYSDRSLFGTLDVSPTRFVVLPVISNVSDFRYTQLATDMLQQLTPKAASGDSRLKYATRRVAVPNFPVLSGAVQCTPDLTSDACSNCLLASIAQVRDAYDTVPRVRIMKPSCNIRFDINRLFLDPRASSPPPRNKARKLVLVLVPIVVVVLAALLLIITITLRARNSNKKNHIANEESLQFDFDTIRTATDGFSEANQLGRGGFGAVYKGRLPDGQYVAVKRLFQSSKQGDDEFKNEIVLVAKLQHRNLVQLLGFCIKQNEKLLIYEFVENSSLEKFLFDSIKRESLDWKTRYNIIQDIVRGLIYLHEDSQLRIIHRDLKACNILLDAEMNAKISDFGTAKLFEHDQTRGDTRKIMGTYGSTTLPKPSEPAFFINSKCSQMPGQFTDHSLTQDVNELSITELYPR
uniref:non-specific serine/threonine protein kinase n=1 Tax=Cucumis sativus TaxID=3659 RepID=A0A0A0LX67_CUCSA